MSRRDITNYCSLLLQLANIAATVWRAMGELGKAHCVYDLPTSNPPSASSPQRPQNQGNDPV